MSLNNNNNVCRSCRAQDENLQSLFQLVKVNNESLQLAELLIECTSLQVSFEDGLPSALCKECINLLNISYKFKKKCEETEIFFIEKSSLNFENETKLIKKQVCNFCYRKFETFDKLKEHRYNHINKKTLFSCEICAKQYETIDLLEEHKVKHEQFKLYNCKICNNFFTKNIIKDHLKSHRKCKRKFLKNKKLLKSKKIFDKIENVIANENLKTEEIKNLLKIEAKEEATQIDNFADIDYQNLLIDSNNFIKDTYENSFTSQNNNTELNNESINKCCLELGILKTEFENEILEQQNLLVPLNTICDTNLAKITESSCEKCNVQFDSIKQYQKHMRTHLSKEKRYNCPKCTKSFLWKSHLKRHSLIHDNSKFVCRKCDKLFNKHGELIEHQKTHPVEIKCCNLVFESKEELLKHKIATHNFNENDRKYKCNTCSKKFTTERYRNIHQLSHLNGRSFACTNCEKKFTTSSHLKEHEKIHSDSSKYLCSECGKQFSKNHNLVIHIRRHQGVKPYKCKYCDKAFPRSADVKTHEKCHTGEKNHLCLVCGKGFSRADKLTIHMRIHTGEKPYQCKFCESAFTQSYDLKAHIRRHTGERYFCDLCPEKFLMGYLLSQHKFNMHGIEYKTKRVYPKIKIDS